jgi:hypothetical protein
MEYRIGKRKLLKEEVIDAIKNPDRTIKKYGKHYFQKKLDRGTIEVPCIKTERNIKALTVYWL